MDQPPASPGGEGPTQAPPHLPPGWIAQWDANSKKYYYVQLSTGESQWEVPTSAAPVGGGTPAPVTDHPYGAPGGGQRELITHPDGSQTVKHADGSLEPVMPDENGGARGLNDGQTGERGLGSMAMNALLGGGKQSGSSHGGSSNNFGGLANQVLSGLTHTGSGSQGSHGSSGGGIGGKIASQLASNLFSSGSKPATQNYHNGQQTTQYQHSGGLAGSVMGGVANMFGGGGGNSNNSHNPNYGYSTSGQVGAYGGPAPPTSYQPSASSYPATQHTPQGSHPPSYHTTASNVHAQSGPTYQAPQQQPPNSYGQSQAHPQQHSAPQQHGAYAFASGGGYEGVIQQGYPGSTHHTQYSNQHGSVPGPPSTSPYGQSQATGGYGQHTPHGGHREMYPPQQPSSQGQYHLASYDQYGNQPQR